MNDRKMIGIFGIVLVVTSIAKLFGLSLQPLIIAYEKVGITIMTWIAPEISKGVYPASVETLTIYMPLLFTICLALAIVQLAKSRKKLAEME